MGQGVWYIYIYIWFRKVLNLGSHAGGSMCGCGFGTFAGVFVSLTKLGGVLPTVTGDCLSSHERGGISTPQVLTLSAQQWLCPMYGITYR